jgi:hypothetical protein
LSGDILVSVGSVTIRVRGRREVDNRWVGRVVCRRWSVAGVGASVSLAAGEPAQPESVGCGEHLIDVGVCVEFGYVRVHHRVVPLGGGGVESGAHPFGHQ